MHRAAVEAPLGEALLGSVKNMLAPRGLRVCVNFRHRGPGKNERSFASERDIAVDRGGFKASSLAYGGIAGVDAGTSKGRENTACAAGVRLR
jgi:hypothetical protein